MRAIIDFSLHTIQGRKHWNNIFEVLQVNKNQPKILHPEKISFKSNGKIKTFSNKQNIKGFITSKPALQEMTQGILQKEDKWYQRDPASRKECKELEMITIWTNVWNFKSVYLLLKTYWSSLNDAKNIIILKTDEKKRNQAFILTVLMNSTSGNQIIDVKSF